MAGVRRRARHGAGQHPGLDLHHVPFPLARRLHAGSGNVAGNPDGSTTGNGSVPVTAKSGAAIRCDAGTTDSAPVTERSRTDVPTSATTW